MRPWGGPGTRLVIAQLFDTSDFPARWHCGNWTALHGWVHIVSDLLIWGAYMAIPVALVVLVIRRRDMAFSRVFWLFGAFILSCGTVHLIEAIIFWHPIYRVSALMKLVTAAVSWATVAALLPRLPQMMKAPNLSQMNRELEAEVAQRRAAEQRMKQTNEQLRLFAEITTGRELRVIELKRQVNELSEQLGRGTVYDLSVFEEPAA